MLFQTVEFLVFFTCVGTAYFWYRGTSRQWLLLFASYYFYMSWDYRFGALILLSTAIDYVCAIRIEENSENSRKRRLFLMASVVSNLLILGTFKYLGFFTRVVNDASHLLGWETPLPILSLTLPVGISFFTFQSMSHTIDVFRRHIRAERSFRMFALYVAFFPQLVAGPIVRAKDFLPQLRKTYHFSAARFYWGLDRIMLGLVKKVVIADNLSTVVDLVYASPSNFDTKMLWFATFCYSVQIYCDFSGYSDMAIGLARILGFRFRENFNVPYMSRTVSEFWRRWHISLSTWLRDYLYISLGGNRRGRFRRYVNLFVTMLLGGLWHGASFNFIIWGAYHGFLLIIYQIVEGILVPLRRFDNRVFKVISVLVTLILVTTGWVPFRSANLPDTAFILNKMYLHWDNSFDVSQLENMDLTFIWSLLGLVVISHFAHFFLSDRAVILKRRFWFRALRLGLFGFLVYQFSYRGVVPFVYFQF